MNYLYTIEVGVGTPPQKAEFLIDLTSTASYVFLKTMYVEPTAKGWYGEYNKFFETKDSSTIVDTKVSVTNTTLGMLMIG